MRIRMRKKGTVNILDLSGKMTIGEGDVMLRRAVRELLEAGEKRFILNLLDVPLLDSAGIGEVVACSKRAAERDGVIRLVVKGRVHDTFTMTRLDKVFEVFADVEEALASFAS